MLPTCRFATFLVSLYAPVAAFGAGITFDEVAPDNNNGGIPAERYAGLGIHFASTDDGSTWSGISQGDVGNWTVEGTNGSVFSGFNGSSYTLSTTFDAPVKDFTLDVSRTNGSTSSNTFTLVGLLNNAVVDSKTIPLNSINAWSTVTLNGIVDSTVWSGSGTGFHPFGVDNVRWNPVPEPATAGMVVALGTTLLVRRRNPIQS